jgi:hypothetical protein
MRKHDWADELARKIAFDLGADSAERRHLELVAARLRLVKQEGIGEGLDQATAAIRSPTPSEEKP